jgi:hypothetical protein
MSIYALLALAHVSQWTYSVHILGILGVGESVDDIILRLKRDVPRTMKNGILYWPACDYINHRYVPVHLQASKFHLKVKTSSEL